MADIDWTTILQSGVQAATGYVQSQMALKQAKKLAKIQAGAPQSGFPMLGTGNMAFGYSSAPLGAPMGYGYSGGVPMGAVQPAANPFYTPESPMGSVMSYLGFGSDQGAAAGCPALFVPKATSGVRALPLVFQQGPDGRIHYWRHVGSPVEFSRDRAICRSYLKRHGGSLRGRRPR
jgi:hypothetical protein